jgi:hypothetical protein
MLRESRRPSIPLVPSHEDTESTIESVRAIIMRPAADE